ncbi:hypothetical protein JGB26_26720 [Streptomyces flavofungini]|uniref:Transcriptional regulator n=1 Tax=Streptomyces flavofungini TaxID=68200 RepID=A0ABS0XCB6_9ACTN|nr:hypothetical protein [Streptomyces flavofungini]MBJ3810651.1 hypothetical protein [Streptomyces flavofungini]
MTTQNSPGPSQHIGQRIGFSTVGAIDSRLAALVKLDQSMGSELIRPAAEGELSFINSLLSNANYDAITGAELDGLAARAAGIAGWIARDSGDLVAAETLYRTAVALAAASGAADIRAYFTMQLACQKCSASKPAAALQLLGTVESDVRHGALSARTVVTLHSVAAHAHARMGDDAGRARAMDAAHTALDSEGAPPTHSLNSWVSAAYLEVTAGCHLLALGRPRQALHHLKVLDNGAYPLDRHPREAVIHLVCAAKAMLSSHELESAVSYAHRAQDYLDTVRSTRATEAVMGLCHALSAYSSTTLVRDFLDRASTQGRQRG